MVLERCNVVHSTEERMVNTGIVVMVLSGYLKYLQCRVHFSLEEKPKTDQKPVAITLGGMQEINPHGMTDTPFRCKVSMEQILMNHYYFPGVFS